MPVRLAQADDLEKVTAMMRALWPGGDSYDFSDETLFVWDRGGGELGAFISLSVRPWAEGCDSAPVPYVEGWWVAADLRRSGIGRALMATVEQWCTDHGYVELGSDVELDNEVSLQAHAALGFEPTLRVQFFRKRLHNAGASTAHRTGIKNGGFETDDTD